MLISCDAKRDRLKDFIGTEITIKDTLIGRYNRSDTVVTILNTPKIVAYYVA